MPKCAIRLLLPVLCLTLLVAARPAGAQEIDPAFRADIQKLLEITGSAKMGSQMASFVGAQFLDALKKAQPNVPDRAFDIVREVLDAEFAKAFDGPDSLATEFIAIYARNFTHEDVRGLVAFYSTDLGKKTISLLPVVFQESAAAGQKWMERQMPRVTGLLQSRLRAEGFIK